jgi:hypothetical protein
LRSGCDSKFNEEKCFKDILWKTVYFEAVSGIKAEFEIDIY